MVLIGVGLYEYRSHVKRQASALPKAPHVPKATAKFLAAQKIKCSEFADPGSAVIVVAGQSNAANYVETEESNHHATKLGNFFAGKCAVASDPLMGADAELGSLWVRLGNELIRSRKYERVLIVPIALGGTSMDRWRTGGDLNKMLEGNLSYLSAQKLPVTHFLWVQGEADRLLTSPYRKDRGVSYLKGLESIVDLVHKYSHAQIYVAQTSMCADSAAPAEEILWAQGQIMVTRQGVLRGANLDAVWNAGDRYDNCHLTTSGAKKITTQWVAALTSK
jgi:hypothetical protein